MSLLDRTAIAAALLLLSAPAFAAGATPGIVDDPTWPSSATVLSPVLALHQSPALDLLQAGEPSVPPGTPIARAATLSQRLLLEDPLQGIPVTPAIALLSGSHADQATASNALPHLGCVCSAPQQAPVPDYGG